MSEKSGAYGEIRFTLNTAVKQIPCQHLQSAILEIALLNRLRHKNIAELIGCSFKTKSVELKLQRYDCDLYDRVKTTQMTSSQKTHLVDQIIKGVEFIHKNGIIHADLKPQNILLSGQDVRICDFGISLVSNQTHNHNVQTVIYRAPEVSKKCNLTYNEKIDIWSLGCIIFFTWYGKHLIKYIENVEDSSRYVCELLDIDASGKRCERLLRLCLSNNMYPAICKRALYVFLDVGNTSNIGTTNTTNNLTNISKLITKHKKKLAPCTLIARCLQIDPLKRPNAWDLCKTNEPVNNLFKARDIDELEITSWISSKNLSFMSVDSLRLADNIFRRFLSTDEHSPQSTYMKKIARACCFISCSVFSISMDITEESYATVVYVMEKLKADVI